MQMNINKSVKENFDFLNPTNMIKDTIMFFLFYLIKICIFGFVIYFLYKKTGLYDESSIRNYFIFFFVGSVVLYIITFLYFIYNCYNNNVKFSDMNYKGYALGSLLAPSLILAYIIFLVIAKALKVTPLVGMILYAFISVMTLIVLSTGLVYQLVFDLSYKLTKCSNQ